MNMKNINNKLSTNDELMLTCAYRYAIGRHSYVSTLASYIATKYFNRLTAERRAFIAMDIRKTINDVLGMNCVCPIHYDGTVNYDERNGLNDLLVWMTDNVKTEDDLNGIDEIVVYKESYADDAPKLYRIHTSTPKINRYRSEMDIDDLLDWYKLACVFDEKRWKTLHIKYNGKEDTVNAVEVWTKDVEKIPNTDYYGSIKWRWRKVWIPVDKYINGDTYSYIPDEYIIN